MIYFSPAKINIGLSVVARRPDGYHAIESLLYPVPLHDLIEIQAIESETNRIELRLSGCPIDQSQPNSITKAYFQLAQLFSLPAVRVYLHKQIPAQSGLGGGSGDASTFLKAMVSQFQLKLKEGQLFDLALQNGSDCPFFLQSQPALVKGRGELLEVFPSVLNKLFLVLLFDEKGISTREAFDSVQIQPYSPKLADLLQEPIESWKDQISNDFEAHAFRQMPGLLAKKQGLYEAGALYASLSGSGSAVYGIFKTPPAKPFKTSHWKGYI